jgi:hypothetical protein
MIEKFHSDKGIPIPARAKDKHTHIIICSGCGASVETTASNRKWCVACKLVANLKNHREASRRWHKNNREKEREQNRRYAKANPEKPREWSRRRYANNPEKHHEQKRRWREVNREKHLKQRRHDINAIIRQTLAGVHSFIRDRLRSDTPLQANVDNAHAIELMMDSLHEAMAEYPVETTTVDRAFWDIEEVFDFEDDPDKRAAHLQRIERLLEDARAAIAPPAEETLEQRPETKPETGSPLTEFVVEKGIPLPADKRGKRKAKIAAADDAREPSNPWIKQDRSWCLIHGEEDRATVHEVFQEQGRWQIRFKAATARRWKSVGYAYPTVEKAKEAAEGFAAEADHDAGNDG